MSETVRLPVKLAREPFPGELDEHNLQTGSARELHGRQAIRVAGNEDYPVDLNWRLNDVEPPPPACAQASR